MEVINVLRVRLWYKRISVLIKGGGNTGEFSLSFSHSLPPPHPTRTQPEHKEELVWAHRENHVQAKRQGLRRYLGQSLASTLILNFPASGSVRNKYLLFIGPPIYGILLRQPEQVTTAGVRLSGREKMEWQCGWQRTALLGRGLGW